MSLTEFFAATAYLVTAAAEIQNDKHQRLWNRKIFCFGKKQRCLCYRHVF